VRKTHWPDHLIQGRLVTAGDKLKLRFKPFGRRLTELGGLSDPPAGVHLHETGGESTLCGVKRSEGVSSVNVSLRDGKDVCPECASVGAPARGLS
jgi:hypothetical protein